MKKKTETITVTISDKLVRDFQKHVAPSCRNKFIVDAIRDGLTEKYSNKH